MRDLTPREIVAELDRHIVGQAEAKRAVAIAIRNRWRRQQLPEEMRAEVAPKNILMIGPTGVGKTEIARRLAKLTGAPFIKVEATKYTEVGYYGRDVESMIRELVEAAIALVREGERARVEKEALFRTEERLLKLLVVADPLNYQGNEAGEDEADEDDDHDDFDEDFDDDFENDDEEEGDDEDENIEGDDEEVEADDDERRSSKQLEDKRRVRAAHAERARRTRDKFRSLLRAGKLDDRTVEVTVEQRATPVMFTGIGMEQMDMDLQGMFEKILPKQSTRREMKIKEARKVIFEKEVDSLIEQDKVNATAIALAESMGIIFVDEIDKVVASEGKGADVSRQGVQRDLLPIVEGTTVQTRYGYVKTDHVLFVAAGAFHRANPSDLMPELQGRFPIRVELTDLSKADFVRILTEPKSALIKQYQALLGAEGVEIEFTPDAIDSIAGYAFQVNQSTQNIGARRLYTIVERLLEEISFDAPDRAKGKIAIDAAYVKERLDKVAKDEDLSNFIL